MDFTSWYNSFRKVDVHGPQPDVQEPQPPDVQLPEVPGPSPDVQLLASSKIKIRLVAGGNVQKLTILKVNSNPVLNPPAIVTWIIAV